MTTSLNTTTADRRSRKPVNPKRVRGGKAPGYKLSTRDRRKKSEIRWAGF